MTVSSFLTQHPPFDEAPPLHQWKYWQCWHTGLWPNSRLMSDEEIKTAADKLRKMHPHLKDEKITLREGQY